MSYILSLDQGTTSSRAVIFDHNLVIRSVGQVAFEQLFPTPGWVEHDPEAIWKSMQQAITLAFENGQIERADINAIGITNQRETTVVWNRKSGRAIYPAIVWQDRRTADHCTVLRDKGEESRIHQITGLVLDPYFSATKISWILDNVDGARDAARRGELACGTIDSWLIWKLTEGREHLIEVSNASRTMLVDIHTGQWDDGLLDLFDIPKTILPTIVASSGKLAIAADPRLKNIPITGIAGDQQAALFGQHCLVSGESKCTYGTGCFLLTNTGTEVVHSKSRLLSTIAWSINGHINYALEGSVFMGGALVQWLRDGLGIVDNAAEIEALALAVSDNGGISLVPAFAGLGAPYWDPAARGVLIGLTRGTNKSHIARAALEAIAMQVADVLEAMQHDLGKPLVSIKVDGGACANNLLMQIQADVSDLSIIRAQNLESTALGAAALAGLGIGHWRTPDDLASLCQTERQFSPDKTQNTMGQAREAWQRAVKRAMDWEHHS